MGAPGSSGGAKPFRSPWVLGCGLAHGVLLFLSFPPLGLWWFAIVAALPVCWVAGTTVRPVRDGALVMLGVLPFWIATHLWVADVAIAGFPVLVLFLSGYSMVFVLLSSMARAACSKLSIVLPTGLVLGLVWIAVEFFRARIGFSGYGWYQLGHPLIDGGVLASPGRVGGVELLSLLLVALSGSVVDFARGWRRSGAVVAGLVVGVWGACVVFGGGAAASSAEPMRVAVVQTNVPQDNKIGWGWDARLRDFRRMLELTVEAGADPEVDLILWPETMFPGLALDEASASVIAREQLAVSVQDGPDGVETQLELSMFRDELLRVQALVGVPIVVGAEAMEGFRVDWDTPGQFLGQDARFNSAMVLHDGRVLSRRYDKVRLTPFGEMMPYISAWPWLESKLLRVGVGAEGLSFSLAAGDDFSPLVLPDGDGGVVNAAAPICFEITISDHVRRLAADSGVIVNLTNDGWFGGSSGGRLAHLQQARWRAYELGKPVVRAANTGISAVIDGDGAVLSSGAAETDGVVAGDVRPVSGLATVFSRGGWVFAPVAASLGGAWLLFCGIVLLIRRGPASEGDTD